MKKINLSLIFHLHQPVGNFEEIFDLATRKAYLPVLSTLLKHKNIHFGLHVSGPLLEYFEQNQPEIFDMISEMSERGSLELIGGGFYEPVLPVIPERDAVEQLEWMNDFLDDHFAQRPMGAWLPERIWEPHLPELLGLAGIKYTFVDDYHFKSVGVDDNELFGYYITEHAGMAIRVMPISEQLRYLIPFAKPEEVIQYLESIATHDGKRIVTFADDAEKFGLWPDTYDWVWKQGWFENFVNMLQSNSEWLILHKPSSVIENIPAAGRIYLPTGSYFEMGEWTLPPEMASDYSKLVNGLRETDNLKRLQPFIKGGFWRNFFTKYEESNWMHKRMLYVSQKLSEKVSELKQENQELAERALYSAQCNCAYWHGFFGGLYMPHLRHGVWENLLECERLLDDDKPISLSEDIDCDGFDEVLLASNSVNMWIKPSAGGAIRELSLPDVNVNLTDLLSRYNESYHLDIGDNGESIDDNNCINSRRYDKTPRLFAVDHFIPHDTSIEDFQNLNYRELGDFSEKPFNVIDRGLDFVEMERKGFIRKSAPSPVDIRKKITLDGENRAIVIDYMIKNIGEKTDFQFAVEANLAPQSRDDPEKYFIFPKDYLQKLSPSSMHDIVSPGDYEYIDNVWGIKIKCVNDAGRIWLLPLYTINRLEKRYDKVYQGSSLVHLYRFELESGSEHKIQLRFEIETLKHKEDIQQSLFD